jgi:hypothetical protein
MMIRPKGIVNGFTSALLKKILNIKKTGEGITFLPTKDTKCLAYAELKWRQESRG